MGYSHHPMIHYAPGIHHRRLSRGPLRIALGLGVALGLAAACRPSDGLEPSSDPADASEASANLALIVIDSLRADHLGCHGYPKPTSPTIDRLASEGARFEAAVASTSWTLPSHAAMFTGLHDSAHGVMTPEVALAPGHRTLAETLGAAGYRTAGFYGGPFLHPTFGLHQGFETWRSCMAGLGEDASPAEVLTEAAGGAARTNSASSVTGPRTVEAVRAWFESQDPARTPFFLFVHLWDVHYDYAPHPELLELFDPGYEGSLDASDFDSNPAIHPGMDPRDLEHLLALYDSEIRFTDGIVADLLALLDEHGLTDSTLVVLTSDHGEEFFDHGAKGHQHELWDELIRVPWIARWPGRIEPGTVVTDQVSLVDLAPTVLGLLEISDDWPRSGRDLTPLLTGGALPPRAALSELDSFNVGEGLRTLRTLELKVFSKVDAGAYGIDLRADPGETVRLRPRDHEAVQARLAELRERVRAARALHGELGAAGARAEASPELLEALEALGYLGDG